MTADILSFAYAATVAAGGIFGYVKAGENGVLYPGVSCKLWSLPSLGAGLLFGGLLGYGAFQTSQNPNNYHFLLGTSAVLGGIMGMRFYNSGKIMPAGLITAISVAMVLRLAARSAGLVAVKSD